MKFVGIDLGTTNTVVAAIGIGGCKIIYNNEGKEHTPSVVTYYDNELRFGEIAENYWEYTKRDTIYSIKRLMGRAFSDREVQDIIQNEHYYYEIVEPSDGTSDSLRVIMGGQEYSPADISALILKKAKEDAEIHLGEITHAVLTVPAYFSDKQKLATREAGLKAGLTVMKLLEEPTAAAMAYSIDSNAEGAKTILVFDMGGGTFDISVLVMTAGTFAPLNLEGDMWLGGDNFDQLLIEYLLEQLETKYGFDFRSDVDLMIKLKSRARRAKEILSSALSAPITLTTSFHKPDGETIMLNINEKITRNQFEEIIQPYVAKAVALVAKAVKGAHMELEEIDYVLMVGGSTFIPMVQQEMEKLFGKEKILRSVHPMNSVAVGAAILAGSIGGIYCDACDTFHDDLFVEKCSNPNCGKPLQGVKPTVICPHCQLKNDKDNIHCAGCQKPLIIGPELNPVSYPYGIQAVGDKFIDFIDKNDLYPTPEAERQFRAFKTHHDDQRLISLPVYGGENLEKASENEKMGEAFAVLPPQCPRDTKVLVKLWLDKDGIFEVSARMENGHELNPLILRGEYNQKIRDDIVSLLDMIEGINDKEQLRSINDIKEKMFDDINNRKYDAAASEISKIDQLLASNVHDSRDTEVSLSDKGDRLCNYVNFIINRYDWLIGKTAVYEFKDMMSNYYRAENDRERSKIIDDMDKKIDEIIEGDQILWFFINSYNNIFFVIQPVNPVAAANLQREFEMIEEGVRHENKQAFEMIPEFRLKLREALENLPSTDGAIECPNCGHRNPRSELAQRDWACDNCKQDLKQVIHLR